MRELHKRLQRLESRPKPAGDANQMTLSKLQMLVAMGEDTAVAKWPKVVRVFDLLRLAQERRNRG
jgi:hypothetical protein